MIKLLQRKGLISSLIGFLMALPINFWAVVNFLTWNSFTEEQLKTLLILNIIAWVWVVLPSKISIKFMNGEFIIED